MYNGSASRALRLCSGGFTPPDCSVDLRSTIGGRRPPLQPRGGVKPPLQEQGIEWPSRNPNFTAHCGKVATSCAGAWTPRNTKDYVLVLLFVKYVEYAGQKDALLDVPKGGGFADLVALKGKEDIGDKMNTIISCLAEANDLKGVIDIADFNDDDKLGKGKEMVDRLSNLASIFDNPALDFRGNRAEGDDILGDAYEYLALTTR
jgi:type I restriction-modification system DNA methylase subunit